MRLPLKLTFTSLRRAILVLCVLLPAASPLFAGTATHFSVVAPAVMTAGLPYGFTVTALDALNSVDTSYAGTVHFTSSDGQAVLPADSGLPSGAGSFLVTLKTAGNQTITATDTVTPSVTGTSNAISVTPGGATHFSVVAPGSVTAGAAFNFTVTALDLFNNTATAYAGIITFTSSDTLATLPAPSTLTSGVGTFSATLRTGGSQTITATGPAPPGAARIAAVTPSLAPATITGTSNAILVGTQADLSITKTASISLPYGGFPITYTLVVSNGGPATATGVTITDPLPAGSSFVSATPGGICSGTTTITCAVGTLNSGASATVMLVVTAPLAGGTVSNTATVSGAQADPNPANNSSTANLSLSPSWAIPTLSELMLLILVAVLALAAVLRLR